MENNNNFQINNPLASVSIANATHSTNNNNATEVNKVPPKLTTPMKTKDSSTDPSGNSTPHKKEGGGTFSSGTKISNYTALQINNNKNIEEHPIQTLNASSSSSFSDISSLPSPSNNNDAIQWHALPSSTDAVRILASDATNGLLTTETNQRLKIVGKNELTPPPKPTFLKRLWAQINNILVFILIAAAIVSGILKEWAEVGLIIGVLIINIMIGILQEGNAEKAAEALKAMLSSKAMVIRNHGEKSLIEASELVPGDIIFIQSGDRIPADIRLLTSNNLSVQEAMLTGESLPVSKNANLKVPLNAALGDRKNMGFSATLVLNGTGTGIVVETGDWSEIGNINRLVAGVDTKGMKTRLMVQLEIFGRFISIVVFIIGISALLIAHLGRNNSIGTSFQAAVAIAVAIIPEGLPAVVTITLAIGVQAMANHKAIIRQLPAVETLGSLNVICSDKTGTLTKNEMTAVNIVTRNHIYDITGTGYSPEEGIIQYTTTASSINENENKKLSESLSLVDSINLRAILLSGALCNDSSLTKSSDDSNTMKNKWKISGDPTELALLCAAIKSGLPKNLCSILSLSSAVISSSPSNNESSGNKFITRTGVIPFESEYKFMGTSHPLINSDNSSFILFCKGAPDRLLPRCSYQFKTNIALLSTNLNKDDNTNLSDYLLTESSLSNDNLEPIDMEYWNMKASMLGSKGLRVLALIGGILPSTINARHLTPSLILNNNENNLQLTILGLVAIMDPPRDEVKSSINEAHTAGIVVKMITGDHPQTAIAIGKMLNIVPESNIGISESLNNKKQHDIHNQPKHTISIQSDSHPVHLAITGPEIDKMTDEQLQMIVIDCNIFARASPENKIRIVKALQARGLACSMTGDGVNDAPALKAADVGVAMGITGTDVSKEAAKMVLADDNFSSIVEAVKEGRRVWDNLRKILLYNIPVNFAQGFATFFAYIIGIPEAPLTPIQILYVNMITSVTMGIAIAFEPAEPDVMKQPPRPSAKRIFGKQALWRCIFVSGLMVVAILGQFQWNLDINTSLNMARAEAFTTLVMCEIAYAFNTRFLRSSSLSLRIFQGNKWFYFAIFATAGLQVLLVHVPYLNYFFSNEPLDGIGWGRCIGLALVLFIIVEIEKYLAPRYIMPFLTPFIRCLRKTVGKGTGGILSIKDHNPEDTKFIATSASTFGFALGAGSHVRDTSDKPLEPVSHGGIRTESTGVLLAKERTRSSSLNNLTTDDILKSLSNRHVNNDHHHNNTDDNNNINTTNTVIVSVQ